MIQIHENKSKLLSLERKGTTWKSEIKLQINGSWDSVSVFTLCCSLLLTKQLLQTACQKHGCLAKPGSDLYHFLSAIIIWKYKNLTCSVIKLLV